MSYMLNANKGNILAKNEVHFRGGRQAEKCNNKHLLVGKKGLVTVNRFWPEVCIEFHN